jgi:hypothetical protein
MNKIRITFKRQIMERKVQMFCIIFLCYLFVFIFRISGEETKIVINQEGDILCVGDILRGTFDKEKMYKKNDVVMIVIKLEVVGKLKELLKEYGLEEDDVKFVADDENGTIKVQEKEGGEIIMTYFFVLTQVDEDRKIDPIKLKTAAIKLEILGLKLMLKVKEKIEELKFPVKLLKSGKQYTSSIVRYDSKDDKLKQTSSNSYKIFKETFRTYHRYYIGLNAGLFFPFSKTDTYGLQFTNSEVKEEQNPTVVQSSTKNVKAIIFLSFYPGIEPERKIEFKHFYQRFHFNVGTEVSNTILKRLYLGLGFEFSNFSLNIFYSTGKEDKHDPDYPPGTVIKNPKITTVPLIKESISRWGIVISVPIDVATGPLGKLIGI